MSGLSGPSGQSEKVYNFYKTCGLSGPSGRGENVWQDFEEFVAWVAQVVRVKKRDKFFKNLWPEWPK